MDEPRVNFQSKTEAGVGIIAPKLHQMSVIRHCYLHHNLNVLMIASYKIDFVSGEHLCP